LASGDGIPKLDLPIDEAPEDIPFDDPPVVPLLGVLVRSLRNQSQQVLSSLVRCVLPTDKVLIALLK